jgi:hypothetical protein
MPSFRMFRCVAHVKIDVSEEHIAIITRVEKISEIRTLEITCFSG